MKLLSLKHNSITKLLKNLLTLQNIKKFEKDYSKSEKTHRKYNYFHLDKFIPQNSLKLINYFVLAFIPHSIFFLIF